MGAWVAGLLLGAPLLLGLIVEPWLLLRADRARDRRSFVRAGYLAMAAAGFAAALSPGPAFLIVAFALVAPLWGTGIAVSQAALVELDPAQAERAMTRWTLAASLGDVAGPLLLAALAWQGAGWRAAFAVVAVGGLVLAAGVPSLPRQAPGHPQEAPRLPLRLALSDRRLVAWAFGTWSCSLLDEILLVLAALHLAARHAASERALVLAALLAGGPLGLVLLDRLLPRVSPRRLLAAACTVCLLSFVAWVLAPSLAWALLLAPLVGASIAWQYPLAQAQTYRAAPGHAGVARAVEALFEPLNVVVPLALAALHAEAGSSVALLVLLAQPLLLLLLLASVRRD